MLYFIAVTDDHDESSLRIKAGYTRDWASRTRDYTAQDTLGRVAPQIEELCLIRAQRSDESKVHRSLAEFRWPIGTEVYRPVPEVVDYVRWLRDQHYVWVPDDPDCMPIEQHEVVDASAWLPSPDRRKSPPRCLPGVHGPLNLPPREVTADDFYTKDTIIDVARRVMGRIDLDPASHPVANRVVKATRFFTRADNGLSHQWAGKVWLNPPFSEWAQWVRKVVDEWRSGRVEELCVLAATRTLTAQYFTPLKDEADALCVFNGRIAFWGGHATSSPDDGHAVFYFGTNRERFRECFSELGTVFYCCRRS